MKKSGSLLIILLLGWINLSAQNNKINNENNFEGAYFNQTPPGLTPEIFAPGIISTDEFEFYGNFTPDGKEYFFTRRPDYQGSANRIYYSKFENNKWTTPQLAPFAKDIFEFEPALTPDGKHLYFYSERSGNRDSRFDGDIWITSKTNDGWSEPKYFLSPVNKKYCMTVSSSLEGNIFFTTGFDGKYGIFTSKNSTKEKSEIKFLPDEVNSIGAAHAFIAPDESYIIMDAQPTGRGKPELFISFKDKDGNWLKAINMGSTINATKTEFGATVSPDGKYLFFHRRVNGKGDIYWVDAKVIENLKSDNLKK